MDYKYKSHRIVITTCASVDRNGYTPEFRITKKAPKLFQDEKLNNVSRTKEEAGNFALDLAKEWIDGKEPNSATSITQKYP
jgi:hypothetical protein